MKKQYKSAVDGWLALVLILAPLSITVGLVSDYVLTSNINIAALVGLVGIGLVYGLFLLPIRYTFQSEVLLVRFGVLARRIRYDEITGAAFSKAPWSSPALSMKRIHISRGQKLFGGLLISPTHRSQFLDDLGSYLPEFERQGDALVPRQAD